jgi:hypothetical protein
VARLARRSAFVMIMSAETRGVVDVAQFKDKVRLTSSYRPRLKPEVDAGSRNTRQALHFADDIVCKVLLSYIRKLVMLCYHLKITA